MAARLIEGIGDAYVQVVCQNNSAQWSELFGELQKLLVDLQAILVNLMSKLSSFVTQDIALAENGCHLRGKTDATNSRITQVTKDSCLDLMPQLLASGVFFRWIYERSIDMVVIVV